MEKNATKDQWLDARTIGFPLTILSAFLKKVLVAVAWVRHSVKAGHTALEVYAVVHLDIRNLIKFVVHWVNLKTKGLNCIWFLEKNMPEILVRQNFVDYCEKN